ncbi:MAG TPA: tetratricopeptide repeat protein [Candidatus Acidoferrales bacterium]|nr:tetratricopeptide repeat protein [Candidatus Acidoferrales bacterium]
MPTQDTPAELLIKLWPWLEANKNRLIGALVAVVVFGGILFFMSSERQQRDIAAGQALTALVDNPPAAINSSEMAASLERVAATYPGTGAGLRARLQAAGALFDSGNYADAQAQFQKYLDTDSTGPFAATAQLGVAACLEAENKLDQAANAYLRVLSAYPGSPFVTQAEFGLGRIAEEQHKFSDAVSYYDKVAAGTMGGTLGQEAALRSSELKLKMAAAVPKPAAAPQMQAAPKATATPPPATKP